MHKKKRMNNILKNKSRNVTGRRFVLLIAAIVYLIAEIIKKP